MTATLLLRATPGAQSREPLAHVPPATVATRRASLWRYFLSASLLGLAWGTTENLAHAANLLRLGSWGPVIWFLTIDLTTAYWAIFLVLLADRVAVRRWPWWTPYVVLLSFGGLLGQALQTALLQWLIPLRSLPEGLWTRGAVMRPLIEYFGYLVYCLPAALMYASLRRVRQQTAGLHVVQTEQAALGRTMAESRLQAMQTQLDPHELFEALAQIELLQGQEPARSLRALDALIRYLRLGVPRGAGAASTLLHEIALARARLELQRELRGVAPHFQAAVIGSEGDALLPAMILRPLLELASADSESAEEHVRLEATIMPPHLMLKLRGPYGGCADSADALRAVRERLALLYGAQAKLEWQPHSDDGPAAACIFVHLPYERAHGSHR